MATAGGCELDLEGFEKQLQSLFKSFKNSSSSSATTDDDDAVQVDHRGKTFCSDFSKLVEEYTCHWQTPLPRLRILEVALCYFVRGSYLFRVGCDDVRSMLSSLALSVFELLLFFDEKDFNKDPLLHFTIAFQECHMCLVRHQNVHLTQVSTCIQDGGPWANATLQSILEESTIPQTEVDTFISSQLPVVLELRLRYLLACERISEAMALAKSCSQHPTAGQHHFFIQVYLTCLHKTSQHDRLDIEVAQLNGKDAVQIICNMESEERDESIVLTLARAFLSQQLRRGYMDHLGHLVFLWSKLQLRIETSKEVLIEEIQQLMLTATNVNSIFPFIKVLLEELGTDGHQFCVELCTKALQSCLPCDVPTKSLIYKTLAGLFPNDLEMCQICALLVFFLERTVEAFKMVFSLYIDPDQVNHAQASPVSSQVRFETLQVLKMGMHFDPEFWNPITLRANCLSLLSDTVASDAVEEIMAMWVPDYCMKEPDFNSSYFQQRTKVAGPKKRKQTPQTNTAKRFKAASSAVDHPVKKKGGNTGKRSGKKASAEYLRQCFWRLGKTQEDSQAYHRFIVQLSEKNPTKRNVSKLQWIMEDPECLEQSTLSDYRKLRPNVFFFLGDMPYLYTLSNGAAAKSHHHPQTSGAQDSPKEPLKMEPAVVLTPLPQHMVHPYLYPPEPEQQCSSGEGEDDRVYDSDTSMSKIKRDAQEGRELNKDGTSETQAPQANTNVFFFLGDMPYLYTSVSPVAPNRPADKSQHPQTSSVKNPHKDPLNIEPAVVHIKLDSPTDQLNMEPVAVHTKLDSPTDPLNIEPAVVHTKLDSPTDPLNIEPAVVHTKLDSPTDPLINMQPAVVHTKVHSQKDQLKMEPVVVLTKLDSHKHPLNMELPVVLSKLDSHKPPLNIEAAVVHNKRCSPPGPLNMEPVVVHTKLDSPTDPLNMEPVVVHTKLDSPTDPLNMEPVVVHTKLDSPTDPLNMEPVVVHTKLDSPTDPLNMEPVVVHTKLDSPTDRLNMEPVVVHTKLDSSTDPLNMKPAVILTPLPMDMVRCYELSLDPPPPQQQFISGDGEYEDSVCDADMFWESEQDESSSEEDSDWLDLEYVAQSRRRFLKQGRGLNKVHATSMTRMLQANRNGMRAYLVGSFTCPECTNVAYTSSLYLWKHMRRCHNQVYRRMVADGEIPDILPVDTTSLKKEDTDELISYSHRLSTRPVPKRTYKKKDPFVCDFCFKIFDRFYTWKDHQRVHTGEKNFPCEQCGKSFGSIGNLKRHLTVHDGIKAFECKECGKSFTQISSLNRHLRVHTGEKPYQCLQCTSSFTERSSLNVHQRNIHFRQKYPCDECDRSFSQPSNLRRHKATHSGIKSFQCEQCDKGFYHLNELRRHETIHAGIRYQCEQCEKSFGHIESLKRHHAVHNEKPFQCLLCDCSYTTSSSLNRHQRDVHDDPFLSTPMLL